MYCCLSERFSAYTFERIDTELSWPQLDGMLLYLRNHPVPGVMLMEPVK